MADLNMPNLGMTMLEGFIVKWEREDGDQVSEGDALVEVSSETGKLSMVIEAPEDGILRIIALEGDKVKCGGLVGKIE